MAKKLPELQAGLLVLMIGIGIVAGSLQFHIGTLRRMGPGYFPLILGALLTIIGIFLMFSKVAADDKPIETADAGESAESGRPASIRPWTMIVLGMLSFVALGERTGLLPATFVLVMLSALGDRKNTLRECLILAVIVSLAAVIIFHYVVQMRMPVLAWEW